MKLDPTEFREQYRARAEALERVRTQELAAMTEEEAARQIELLCMEDEPWSEQPNWSGLVEQQALFHRYKG